MDHHLLGELDLIYFLFLRNVYVGNYKNRIDAGGLLSE